MAAATTAMRFAPAVRETVGQRGMPLVPALHVMPIKEELLDENTGVCRQCMDVPICLGTSMHITDQETDAGVGLQIVWLNMWLLPPPYPGIHHKGGRDPAL